MKSNFFIKTLTPVLFLGCGNDDNSTNSVKVPDTLPDYALVRFTSPQVTDNPYFGPTDPGITYVYSGGEVGQDPGEEIRIARRMSTRDILGISCLILHDRAYLNGTLIEDTDDWLAQDDEGNVWYFGEFVKNYDPDTGDFLDNEGSWEAGNNSALPGYWIPAEPVEGMVYHQEFSAGEAEDQAEVVAVGETVTTALGTFTDCVVTKDFTRFEPGIYELKYYAPSIGLILEEGYEDDELVEIVQLIAIESSP